MAITGPAIPPVPPAASGPRPGPATGSPAQPPLAGAGQAPPAQARDKAVSKDFAAVFLTQVVEQMMKTVKLGPLDGGQGEAIWRSFMARAMADQIAQSGSTGIARSVERMIRAYKGS